MIAAIVRTASLLAVLLVTGCSFYLAEPRVPKTDLRADLNGSNEVPPTRSRGSGYFEAVYRPSTKVMEYRLNLVGLSGPITMGYMHGPAEPGENAQQIAPINIPIYDNTIWDGVTLTEEQSADVLAGRWYVNVMTISIRRESAARSCRRGNRRLRSGALRQRLSRTWFSRPLGQAATMTCSVAAAPPRQLLVKKVTHWRYVHGMRVMSVPKKKRRARRRQRCAAGRHAGS